MNVLISERIKKYFAGVDWNLLIFLLLFLNVKLVIKIAALIFIYIRRFDLSFGFLSRSSRLPLFYPAMIGIAIFNFVSSGLYKNSHYAILLLAGIGFWVLCILAMHQVKLSVERTDTKKIHETIILFFVINACVSFINLASIVIETGAINPYTYQGLYQKYFMGTGDYIRGVTFDTSTTNAILNAFGVIYFLKKGNHLLSLMCMVVLLITGSNFTNLLVTACLLFVFLFRSTRNQKSIIVIHLCFLFVFMTKISPQNNEYTLRIAKQFLGKQPIAKSTTTVLPVAERPDSMLSAEEKKYAYAKRYIDSLTLADHNKRNGFQDKVSTVLYVKTRTDASKIRKEEYERKSDSSETRLQAIAFLKTGRQQAKADTIVKTAPGKIIAVDQLVGFFKTHPLKILTGNGLGNFSSKLAFRASGLQIAGNYPSVYTYVSDAFKENHMAVYLAYFSTDDAYHSIANSPNSVYLQLLGEYGLIGFFLFLAGYLGYFTQSLTKLMYGIPIMLIMLGAFFVEYWFEQLSVVILFELMMLLDIKLTRGEEPAR